jgi:hypothetical protein
MGIVDGKIMGELGYPSAVAPVAGSEFLLRLESRCTEIWNGAATLLGEARAVAPMAALEARNRRRETVTSLSHFPDDQQISKEALATESLTGRSAGSIRRRNSAFDFEQGSKN